MVSAAAALDDICVCDCAELWHSGEIISTFPYLSHSHILSFLIFAA
jgi:hypothetical protein